MFKNPRSFKWAQIVIFVAYFIFMLGLRFYNYLLLNHFEEPSFSWVQIIKINWLSLAAYPVIALALATLALASFFLFDIVRLVLQANWRTVLIASLRIASLNFAILVGAIMVAIASPMTIVSSATFFGVGFLGLTLLILLLFFWVIFLFKAYSFAASMNLRVLQEYQVSIDHAQVSKALIIFQIFSLIFSLVLVLRCAFESWLLLLIAAYK